MFKEIKRQSATATLVSRGTIVEGQLISSTDIRIEGECRGQIECSADIIIGEGGAAHCSITGQNITIAGKVTGNVSANGSLIITSTGQLLGNVSAQSLLIQDGGLLNGNCTMERPVEAQIFALDEEELQSKEAYTRSSKNKEAV